MQYKYSLHLQFIKPILSNTHGNPKFVDNHRMLSSHKKVNVSCEKCNYTHLVHCPISDLSCDTERKRYKTLNLNKNHTEKNAQVLLCKNKAVFSNRKKYVNKNDAIKVEGKNPEFSFSAELITILENEGNESFFINSYFLVFSVQASSLSNSRYANTPSASLESPTVICSNCYFEMRDSNVTKVEMPHQNPR